MIPLVGCKTVYEGKYDFDPGWRRGRIDIVGVEGSMPKRWPQVCFAREAYDLSGEREGEGVSYRHLNMPWSRTVVVPDATFKAGDWVYLNTLDCSIEHRRAAV